MAKIFLNATISQAGFDSRIDTDIGPVSVGSVLQEDSQLRRTVDLSLQGAALLAAIPGAVTVQLYGPGTDNSFGTGNLIDWWNAAGAMTRVETPAGALAAARDAFKAACLAAA